MQGTQGEERGAAGRERAGVDARQRTHPLSNGSFPSALLPPTTPATAAFMQRLPSRHTAQRNMGRGWEGQEGCMLT